MGFEKLSRSHPDIKDRDRGGPIPDDEKTELKRCFTPVTETHAPPRFKLYEGTDDAEYDYYGVVTNRTSRFFGFDEAEYIATINAMESTPFITEHRSPATKDENHITTVK